MALLVGLTGGMGAGKSTVSDLLSHLGAHIIDADQICRELVEPEKPAWREIVETFGKVVLTDDKTLNRKKLAGLIFDDPEKKSRLESILHPRVFEEEQRVFTQIAAEAPRTVVILDAALLIESGNYRKVDKVILVTCDPEERVRRVVAQGRVSREEALRRLSNQMPERDKVPLADYVLANDSSIENLEQKVRPLYDELKRLA
ncbi:MAG: dephospho-CoA kinase [Nitrospina sp.]|nr:dephospho-CoA kinase [Nitrospina sp.]